jgi:hypothetical protein
LNDYVARNGGQFHPAVEARRQTFGSTERGRINDLPNAAVAASFLSLLDGSADFRSGFVSPPGLDITPVVERGGAVLFAWAADYSPAKPINQFSPRRFHQNTLFRMATVVK